MRRKTVQGFTLIELLVVISIIGMLASITLAALSSARASGRNGRIVEETTQLRAQIEQTWDGTAYAMFNTSSYGPSLGGIVTSIVAARGFADTKAVAIINDILATNEGQYGGGSISGTRCPITIATALYNADLTDSNVGYNGLSIYVWPPCAPVTKYAIYSAKIPVPLSNPTDPGAYGGYFCVDSTGNAINTSNGWVPGYTGSGPFTSKVITDGQCH